MKYKKATLYLNFERIGKPRYRKNDMRIVKYGEELSRFNDKILIYGMGVYGKRLYMEAACAGHMRQRLFVCDENREACRGFSNFVQKERLGKFVLDNADAIIVICIKNESVLEYLYADAVNIGWNQEKIYRYVPETGEEFADRKKREGFFNGEKTVFLMEDQDVGTIVENKIAQNIPFLMARWGSVEGTAVMYSRLGMLSESEKYALCNNAGVFPINDSVIKEYIEITECSAAQMDIMCIGFWCRQIEPLFRIYSSKAVLAENTVLPPCNNRWVGALKHKKVLVIHPFAPLIQKQYRKREKLFKDDKILPEFELITYQAVQSQGGYRGIHHG